MKKRIFNIYTKATVLLLIVFAGCTDVLNEQPRAVLTPDFFETGDGLQAGITAAYSQFRYYFASEQGMNLTVWGTDEYNHAQQTNNPTTAIYTGLTPEDGNLGSAWDRAYPAINTCNGVIQLGPAADDLTEDQKTQLIAEAKFIRAQWYFILVRTFGGATLDLGSGPLAFNTTPRSDLTRASEDDVYQAIIDDLEDAVLDLPDGRPTTPGRAWKASALHLLAKVYLARGWKDNSTSDFQAAFDNAMDLINNRGTYGVELLENYADVHTEGNEWSSEVLWTIEWNGNVQYNNVNDHGNLHNNISNFLFREFYVQDVPGMIRDVANGRPWIRYSPTPWLIDVAFADKVNDQRYDGSFQTVWIANDETPYDADPEEDPYPHWTQADVDAGLVDASQLNQRRYTLGDTAQYHVPKHIQDSFGSEAEAQEWAARKGYVVSFPDYGTSTSFSGVGRNFQNKHFPSLSKFDRVARPVEGTDEDPNIASTRPFIVYRFAETYLVAAEAALRLGNGQAVGLINEVRDRAGALLIAEGDLTGPHGDEIDFILDERARELAGEQMRWFDLKRTGKLRERVSADAAVGTGAPAVYNRQYNDGAPVAGQQAPRPQTFHLLRPIPQGQIDLVNGEYPQNPGYSGN